MLNQAFLIYFFYTEKLTVTEFCEIFSNSFWDIWATDKHKWKRNLMVEIIRDLIFICMFTLQNSNSCFKKKITCFKQEIA